MDDAAVNIRYSNQYNDYFLYLVGWGRLIGKMFSYIKGIMLPLPSSRWVGEGFKEGDF